MRALALFYNASCSDCAQQARRTRRLDWFGRIDLSTEVPPCGPLEIGEIAVLHRSSGRVFTGIDATRAVCMNVPVYFLYGLALHLPPVRRLAGRRRAGRGAAACRIGEG